MFDKDLKGDSDLKIDCQSLNSKIIKILPVRTRLNLRIICLTNYLSLQNRLDYPSILGQCQLSLCNQIILSLVITIMLVVRVLRVSVELTKILHLGRL